VPPVRLSIVVPTLGRSTLRRTLDSIAPQLDAGDEVLVVADATGDVDGARATVEGLDDGRFGLELCADPSPGAGNAQRRHGIGRARGTHLAFIDDDDVYEPGALELMRSSADGRPVVFRMDATAVGLGVLWAEPVLRYANVGTPMFVVPNDPGRLGEWAPCRGPDGSDFSFITGCCERMGEPVWREEVVARVRPGAGAEAFPWLTRWGRRRDSLAHPG
jgi:glycosyltransferase involved in cell wall biosynthesis